MPNQKQLRQMANMLQHANVGNAQPQGSIPPGIAQAGLQAFAGQQAMGGMPPAMAQALAGQRQQAEAQQASMLGGIPGQVPVQAQGGVPAGDMGAMMQNALTAMPGSGQTAMAGQPAPGGAWEQYRAQNAAQQDAMGMPSQPAGQPKGGIPPAAGAQMQAAPTTPAPAMRARVR